VVVDEPAAAFIGAPQIVDGPPSQTTGRERILPVMRYPDSTNRYRSANRMPVPGRPCGCSSGSDGVVLCGAADATRCPVRPSDDALRASASVPPTDRVVECRSALRRVSTPGLGCLIRCRPARGVVRVYTCRRRPAIRVATSISGRNREAEAC
jgi:hypothetical protein